MVRRMSEQNNHDTTNNSRRNPAAADGPSMQTAYFAGGCFWGLERYFQNVDGVTDTTSVTRSRRSNHPPMSRCVRASPTPRRP